MTNNGPQKIIMTTDAIGGVWTYATTLAAGLAAAGLEIYLVTMGPHPHDDQLMMVTHPNVHLISTNLSLEWQDPAGEGVSEAQCFFRKLEDAIQPDLVHLNSYREACFDWTAPVLITAHSCVVSWAIACNDGAFLAEPRWRQYFNAVAMGLDRAQLWVAPTSTFCRMVSALYRPRVPGAVIWNGADCGPDAIGQKDDFILAAGRMWDRAKNLGSLAKATASLDWPIKVAGPTGGDRDPASHNLKLLGSLSNRALREQMQRAAIFASPALYEPFGLSVLEAACNGCALVLSDIPTFRELWNGAAVFVDPDDALALEQELSALVEDNLQRNVLQRAARQRAKRYTVDRMVAAYLALYASLLPARSASSPHRFVGASA